MTSPIVLGNCLDVMRLLPDNSFDAIVTDPPYGLSFMGKKWDYDVPSVDVWRECLRVLKPGAHALVACGTRTQHRMVVNIEDAGFEIRDVITWLYGQGFPKSLDISKAIDKAAGAERALVPRIRLGNESPSVTTQKGWKNSSDNDLKSDPAAITDAAKQWQGWGTALKPAAEFWTLVRKPISEKNVAANVLKHGTGGINIDGCRIPVGPEGITKGGCTKVGGTFGSGNAVINKDGHSLGRFPANLLLDEEAAALLDEMSGTLSERECTPARGADSGGASRFFYCAKVSPSERGADNKHPTVKPIKLMRYLCRLITPPGGHVLDPFCGSGSTGVAAKAEGFVFTGIEMDEGYAAIAAKRVEGAANAV